MSGYAPTVKRYDSYPYDREFDACVLAARPGKTAGTMDVVLDETLFFPEEGGQTPDRGRLGEFPVVDVQISKDGIITHTVDVRREVCVQAHPDGSDTPAGVSGQADGIFAPGSGTSLPGSGHTGVSDTPVLVPPFLPGQFVHGVLDWAHRFSNMQNHSGEHILSGLLHSTYGYENVGFRLSDNTVTLDTSGHLTPEQLLDLERRANEVVWRNVPVTCEYPEPERLAVMEYRSKKDIDGAVRIVTIEGVDVCACCAPHVRRTGEIGLIKILSAIHSRGGSTRLTLVCGLRALEIMQQRQGQVEESSRLMNEPQETIAEGVTRLQEEISGLKEAVRSKEQRIIEIRLAQALEAAARGGSPAGTGTDARNSRPLINPGADASNIGTGPDTEVPPAPGEDAAPGARDFWVFEPTLSPLSQRSLMNRLCDMGWRYAGVFAGSENEGYKYLIGSRGADARVPNQRLREKLGARGGGKPDMVQGSVAASEETIREVLSHL